MKSHALHQSHPFILLLGAAFLLMSFVPLSASAATKTPSCTLTVTVGSDSKKITKSGDILVPKGGLFGIAWTSKNADTFSFNDGGKGLAGGKSSISGSEEFSPKKTTTYQFEFKNSSNKKVVCEVTAHVANGSIDGITSGTKPALSGEVSGVKKVNVAIYEDGKKKPVFEKKNISVKRGAWEAKPTKALSKGTYSVVLTGDPDYAFNTLASATLTIGDVNKLAAGIGGSSKGNLTVTTLPLLSGGTTRAGASVPIVYLQLRNTGSEAAHVTGFNIKQNGSASANVITSLSTVDDKGGSRATSAANPFKNGSAFAPTDAIIAPGAVKLFTIKAQLGANVAIGTNLMLDITGVESNGSEKGAFPLRGTTWTVGY